MTLSDTPDRLASGTGMRKPVIRIDPGVHQRVYHLFHQGAGGINALARAVGLPRQTVRRLVDIEPNMHGLDLDTARRCRDAQVPYSAAAYLIASHATATIKEQAAHLGTTRKTIDTYRVRLTRAGLLNADEGLRAQSILRKQGERDRIIRLLKTGITVAEVAEACEASTTLVRRVAALYGGVEALQSSARRLTLRAVAGLFSLDEGQFREIVQLGYLNAPRREATRGVGRNYKKRATIHTIAMSDVYDFIRVKDAWPRYSLSMITDPELRRYAALQRSAAGGVWRSFGELCDLADISKGTGYTWLKKGWLTGWERVRYARIVYYWHRTGVDVPRWKA